DQTVKTFERTARSLCVPLKVVRDTYQGDRKEFESRLVLVRPDQYVVWAGDEPPDDTTRLMRKVAGIV
ncbi:MAG: monooxygenase, partial [Chloroflexi bacterium]|nr:monooxygenase [Chloroflexota bacterium]